MDNGIYKGKNKIICTYEGMEILEENFTLPMFSQKSINGKPCYFMTTPLYSGKQRLWGALSMALYQDKDIRYIGHIKEQLFIFISAVFILASLLYMFMTKNINNSLKKIISGIEKMDMNRFDYRIEITENDEFSQIAESFNRLAKKIMNHNKKIYLLQDEMIKSAKLTTVGQLSAGIAHEIRNPLSSIKMMVQLISKRYLKSNSGQDEITIILDEIDRINRLAKDLLEYAKPSPMNFRYTDIATVIKNSISIFSYNLERQKVFLEFSADDHLPEVKLDPEKMTLVFVNLVMNAIHAMPEGGKITIDLQGTGNAVLIKFADNGHGIPEELQDTIFEPFVTSREEGTGLGLALVKLIIERHGGTIEFSSQQGLTEFRISLNCDNSEFIESKGKA
jgi:signal transduction histidine kinase